MEQNTSSDQEAQSVVSVPVTSAAENRNYEILTSAQLISGPLNVPQPSSMAPAVSMFPMGSLQSTFHQHLLTQGGQLYSSNKETSGSEVSVFAQSSESAVHNNEKG